MTEEQKRIKLEAIEIPTPCPMLWENLDGDERKRFCDECGKHVHDLSALTRVEAEALLSENEAKLCVSYELTPTGGIKTRDYSETFRCSREAVRGAVGLVAGALVAVCSTLPALAKDALSPHRTMGKIRANVNSEAPKPIAPQTQSATPADAGREGRMTGAPAVVHTDSTTTPKDTTTTTKDSATAPKSATTPPKNATTLPPRVGGLVATPVVKPVGRPVTRLGGEPVARVANIDQVSVSKVNLTDKRIGSVHGMLANTEVIVDRGYATAAALDSGAWSSWHESVAKAVFDSWKAENKTAGQITLRLTVKPGQTISISKMGVPHSAMDAAGTMGDTNTFMAEVEKTISRLQHNAALAFPKTSSEHVTQASFDVTLGTDSQKFPRFEPNSL